MNISVKNLGPIKVAHFSLGDLTVLCGKNNTGKTYITYALYGFLEYWKNNGSVALDQETIGFLCLSRTIHLPLGSLVKAFSRGFKEALRQYSSSIGSVFGGTSEYFKKSNFQLVLSADQIDKAISYRNVTLLVPGGKLNITHQPPSEQVNVPYVTLSLDIHIGEEQFKNSFPVQSIEQGIKEAIFEDVVPSQFIASVERTGASIFQQELDFTRGRVLEVLTDDEFSGHFTIASAGKFIGKFLGKFKADYPLPIRSNIDFIRELSNLANEESFLHKEHPDILQSFSKIIGGEYKVRKDGAIQFKPSGSNAQLSLVESSSSVRALLEVGFYLRHVVKKGDILMIDEPELNLHPVNQRLIARLFARLVNVGIRVFITTHSDYIIKELNTLIMLNNDTPHIKWVAYTEGYTDEELLSAEKVKVYVAQNSVESIKNKGKKKKNETISIVVADITQEEGIEVKSFDDTIDEMNRIQDEIIWGE